MSTEALSIIARRLTAAPFHNQKAPARLQAPGAMTHEDEPS